MYNTLDSTDKTYADSEVVALKLKPVAVQPKAPSVGALTASKTVVPAGETVTLNVAATAQDSGVLAYEWWGPGGKITTEATGSISITGFASGNAGKYQCRVYNTLASDGSVFADSNLLTLTLDTPMSETPSITGQTPSASEAVADGTSNYTLDVSVTPPTDGGTLTYEWWFEGRVVQSGSTSSYQIATFSSANVGSYQCRVYNRQNGYQEAYADTKTVALTLQ